MKPPPEHALLDIRQYLVQQALLHVRTVPLTQTQKATTQELVPNRINAIESGLELNPACLYHVKHTRMRQPHPQSSL